MPNTTVSIRRASLADAPAIAALTAQLGYPTQTEAIADRLQTILNRPDQLLLVADSGTQVCGWLQSHSAEVIECGFRVEILGLVIAEEMRRRGIGRRLVEAAENWAERMGAEVIVVRSNVNREASHAFYAALEYKPAKTQAVYRKALLKP